MPLNTYKVLLGGTYATENVPGTVSDPTDPTNASFDLDPVYMSVPVCGMNELRCIGNDHVEVFDNEIHIGQWIQVQEIPLNSSSSSGTCFDGIVVNKHYTIGGDTETCEIISYDHGSYLLHRMSLHGQMRRSHAQEQTFFTSGPSSGASIVVDMTTDVQTIDTPMVFNPNGEPNMTQDSFTPSSETGLAEPPAFHIFEVPFRDQMTSSGQPLVAQYWTLIDALGYLFNVTNMNWCIDPTSFENTILAGAFRRNPIVTNISVEGDSVAKALTKLLEPFNYGWWVDPSLNTNNLHNIHFFERGNGNTKTLKLSARGTSARSNQSNLVHGDLLIDNAATVNQLRAYGDRISVTTLAHTNPPSPSSSSSGQPQDMLLLKGWKDADLVWPPPQTGETQPNWFYPTFCANYNNPQLLTPPQGEETEAVFGVGRMWIVNQGQVPSKTLEDLSKDLIGTTSSSSSGATSSSSGGTSSSSSSSAPTSTAMNGNNSLDPRRFEKPELYTTNTAGGLLSQEEVIVEMSVDNGGNWQIVDRSAYRLLPDGLGLVFVATDLTRLGIWYGSSSSSGAATSSSSSGMPSVGTGYWQALHDNTLQIRVLCSVKSDERVHVEIDNDGSQFPLAVGAVFQNDGYRKTIYNSAINAATYYVLYPPSELQQDDTPALLTLTQQQLANTNRTVISGSARVLMTSYGEYNPGDCITSITNRTITFKSNPTIVHVLYKFEEQQVELNLDNRRVGSVVRAKAIDAAANMRQHRLGVENPSPMTGANNAGNYLKMTAPDGMNPAQERYENTEGF